jgi:hypothetical protein
MMPRSLAAAALSLIGTVSVVTADIYDENYWKYTGAATCYHTTEEPNSGLYYSSLATCCHQHYTDDDRYNTCIEDAGGTLTGSDKWYVDWSRTPDSCSQDCAEDHSAGCGGYLSPHTTKTKYNTAEECCAAHFQSNNPAYCAAISAADASYAGSGEYYLESSEQLCVKDCVSGADCGGLLTHKMNLYATVEACCAAELSYIDADICKVQSTEGLDGTNKWFVENSICRKDCVGSGPECSSAGRYTTLYDTVDACCNGAGVSWLDDDYCKSRSDPDNTLTTPKGYTDKWYVKWSAMACAKDCDSADAACEPLSANAVLHDTAAACCSAHLGSVDSDACEQASTDGVASGDAQVTGTGKFYADYGSVQRCVADCDSGSGANCGGVAPRNAGVTLFDTAKECCSQKFGWYQQDLCEVLTESAGEGHTDLWYADQGKGVCYKDCDGSDASCNGHPSDYSQALYTDAEKCCTSKLGWINKDTCVSKSSNGPNAPAVGSNKWFVNWQTNMCDKDCDSSAPECRGINDDAYITMYDDAAACCGAHFSYINKDLCVARSMGSTSGSLKFYPDQGAGKCYQDCPTTGGGLCNGPPKDLASRMYDTAEDCCTSSVGWADKATCAGASASALATDEYWINWQERKCVKNCPTSDGAECGGIAKSWNPLYSSVNSCCSQPAFNGVPKKDCAKS